MPITIILSTSLITAPSGSRRSPQPPVDMHLRNGESSRVKLRDLTHVQAFANIQPEGMYPVRRLHHRARRPALAAVGLAAALAAALLGAPAEPAHAATPASGVLDDAHKSVTWQSPVYPKGTVGGPSDCPPAAEDPDNKVCDRFDLTVSTPDGYWDDNPEGGVPISIEWQKPAEDFDMYIYDSAGKQVASSAGTADPEATVIPRADGTYHVIVVPYDVTDNSFTGKAYLPETTDSGNLTSFSGGHGSYSIEAGELKAKADFLTGGQLRLQASPSGEFTDPAGSAIIRKQPAAQKHTSTFDKGDYYGIRSPTPSCASTRSRCASASTRPTTAPASGRRTSRCAGPPAVCGRAWSAARTSSSSAAASRTAASRTATRRSTWPTTPTGTRGLQQLPALLPLQCRLRRLPQHLRARRLPLRLSGADRPAGAAPRRVLLHR